MECPKTFNNSVMTYKTFICISNNMVFLCITCFDVIHRWYFKWVYITVKVNCIYLRNTDKRLDDFGKTLYKYVIMQDEIGK